MLKNYAQINSNQAFADFSLGGGTALSLQFGHRKSIDLDFFIEVNFDSQYLLECLEKEFGKNNCMLLNRTILSLCVVISGIKIDFLSHGYPELAPLMDWDGLRMVSLRDLSAMKIDAVTNRDSKKDFSDLLMLHDQGITISVGINNFCSKYGSQGNFLALRSLMYFDGAEIEPDPRYLNGWSWEEVRKRILTLALELA